MRKAVKAAAAAGKKTAKEQMQQPIPLQRDGRLCDAA
jgi:hypothetical protein